MTKAKRSAPPCLAPATSPLRQLLMEEGAHVLVLPSGERIERRHAVVRRLYEAAEAGEAWAIQLVFERLEGKTPAKVEVDAHLSARPADLTDDQLAAIAALGQESDA